MLKKTFLLGVGITNAKKEEILEYVVKKLEKKDKNFYIVTPNPEFLVLANKKKSFKDILNRAEIASNDGVGLKIAALMSGKHLSDRFTGVDLVEMLCSRVSDRPITVGFLGGRPEVAELAAKCLVAKYPGLKVVYAASEWNPEKKNNPIDILFVAFGFPKQEEWMAEHQRSNIYRMAVGVGGAFDYISGKVPRAPKFVRQIGFEWLFRLIVQPWRIRRQLALAEFVFLVLKEKLNI